MTISLPDNCNVVLMVMTATPTEISREVYKMRSMRAALSIYKAKTSTNGGKARWGSN